jgi:peptide/nickel transport system permease protein
MARMVARRLAAIPLVLLALTAIMFVLNRISPSDEAKVLLGPNASPAAIAAVNHRLYLDRPLPIQYIHYVAGLLQGNFGISLRTHRPVRSDLATYLPATIELALFGLAFALILATVLALLTTVNWPGSGAVRLVLFAGASAPTFLLALGGILLFFSKLHWLPASGETSYFDPPTGPTGFLLIDSLVAGRVPVFFDALRHLILPALCIAIIPAVSIGRILRANLVVGLDSEYARTARVKGMSELAILIKHVTRNSLGAALAMTGLQVGLLLAGVVVIEDVFAWPGIGYYAAQSIPAGDFPGVAGVTLVIGLLYVVINAAVDILQAVADPRIR